MSSVPNLNLKPTPLIKKDDPYEEKQFCLDDFEFGRQLGRGSFGSVKLVRMKTTKYICAMKVINKKKLIKKNTCHTIKREIEILTRIRYHYIYMYIYI